MSNIDQKRVRVIKEAAKAMKGLKGAEAEKAHKAVLLPVINNSPSPQ